LFVNNLSCSTWKKKTQKKQWAWWIMLLTKSHSIRIMPYFIQLYITTSEGPTIYQFYAITLHHPKAVRCIPSFFLCLKSTIEYWNMLSFKPRHIFCQNNSAWTCSKLSYKFPQPSLTTKKINTCKYRTTIKFKKKNHFRSVHKQKTGIKFPIHVWMGRSD
jgi:hypothetical protein